MGVRKVFATSRHGGGVRAPFAFAGFVAFGVGQALWARVFLPDSLLFAVLAIAAAGSAWVAAAGARSGGVLSLAFAHVGYVLGFAAAGFDLVDIGLATVLAGGLGAAAWGEIRGRATAVAAGFVAVALGTVWWLVSTVADGLAGFFPGNVLVVGGALLVAADAWRGRDGRESAP